MSQNEDLGEGFSGEERCLLGDMANELLCFTEVGVWISQWWSMVVKDEIEWNGIMPLGLKR